MLITNAKIVTWEEQNQILDGYGVRVTGGKITEVSPSTQLIASHPGEEMIDAHGQYLMPGNICAHTHFYGAYARGMAIPGPAAKDIPGNITKIMVAAG